MSDGNIYYAVKGYAFNKAKAGQRLPFLVWQYKNGNPVNEYVGYDRESTLSLYPQRRIIPSDVPLVKHSVNVRETRKEF